MAPAVFRILVDTDVLIDMLRGRPDARILLEKAARRGDVFCSVITVAELISGMRDSESAVTEKLLGGLNIVPVDEKIARKAGMMRKESGMRVMLPDCLIAATAQTETCALLTFNRKDYRFKGISFFE